jgi:serine/threonine protein kinase
MGSYQEITPTSERTYAMNPIMGPFIEPGTILSGKFRVIELLGAGGMGSVYRVDHLLMERQFALKCMNKFQEENASWRRFQNEAKAAYMLDHPNLLKVFELGLLDSGQPFFLMEVVEGRTLADEIKAIAHLPIDRAVRIFIQVAFALGYAHERKIIHRDVKPSNIMLVPPKSENEVEGIKVVDFGIAKLTGVDEFNQQTLTRTGEVFGSPFYMSPEQCAGLPVDHRSDLYSLGCVFYEALTSAPPFMGETALATMMKHQSDVQLSLKEASLGVSYPAALEAIICKLLEKDPDNRYQSANLLASDLIALERAIDENKQEITRQNPVLLSVTPENSFKTAVARALKTMTLSKLAVFGVSMYLLGAASLYALMYVMNKQGMKTALVEPAPVQPQLNQQGSEYWSQIEPDRAHPGKTKKTFYFPDNKVVGLLIAANGSTGLARGRVTAPINMKTGFVAGDFITPEYIDKFRPDEISVFDFNAETVDSTYFNAIKKFEDMRILNVSGTAFSDRDLPVLGAFKKLQYLNLSHTDVDCAKMLKLPNIYNLNGIELSHTDGCETFIKNITKFPRLYEIIVSVNGFTDSDIAGLAKSKTLRVIDLSTNTISDKGVANLLPIKSLEWLDLSRTVVTPKVVGILKQFPNLKKVELGLREWSPTVKANIIRELKEFNPKIEVYFRDAYTHDQSILTDFVWQGHGFLGHANTKRLIPPPPTDSITEHRGAPSSSSP